MFQNFVAENTKKMVKCIKNYNNSDSEKLATVHKGNP